MAESLSQKLAKLNTPGPLASRCYGESWVRAEDNVLTVHVSPAEIHANFSGRFPRFSLTVLLTRLAWAGLQLATIPPFLSS
jgi:hypothetical protein